MVELCTSRTLNCVCECVWGLCLVDKWQVNGAYMAALIAQVCMLWLKESWATYVPGKRRRISAV